MKKLLILLLWPVALEGLSQELLHTLPFESTIYGVDISTDGALIFIAGKDTTATVWNNQHELVTIFRDHLQPISSIDFLDKASTVLTGSYDHTAMLWGLDGKRKLTLEGHTNGVINIAQSSEFLATASRDGTAKIWARSGRLLFTLNHDAQVNDIQFIEDKQWIITGSFDETVKVWNHKGKLLRTFQGHSSGIRTVSISLAHNLLLMGHKDGNLSMLNLEGDMLKTVAAHGLYGEAYKMILSSEFIPKQPGFITAGADGYVRTWDLTGKMVQETIVAPDKDAYVSGIALSGTTLFTVSGGKNPSLKIWKLK